MTPEEVLELAVERHGSRLVLLCSFQKTSSVLVDMLTRITDKAMHDVVAYLAGLK